MTKMNELAYWINERYAMKELRENTPVPVWPFPRRCGWSDDPAMGTVRYCNVHREDDKVTRWMRENWSTAASPYWWFVLGRMLNYIPTLEAILRHGMDSFTDSRAEIHLPYIEWLRDELKALRDSGKKVFTSVYTISTCGESMDKIDYVMRVVQDAKDTASYPGSKPWPRTTSLSDCHSDLMHIGGLGSFLAAQVVADIKNTKGHHLSVAPDWWDWCAPGPGSIKGLQEYFYGPDSPTRITPGNFYGHIMACYDEVMPLVNKEIPRISMQDFQNCLCEFSKYERVKRGGHVRNRYTAA